nr:uncharacterized protein LOC109147843 [Ipomoea batatas]
MASSSKGKEPLEKQYATLTIVDDDKVKAYIDEESVKLEAEANIVVGTLLIEKPIKSNIVKKVLASVWRPGRGMIAKEISTNLFVFHFYHEKDRRRVIEDGPWSYEQSLLIPRKIENNISPFEVDLSKADFWYEVPIGERDESIVLYLEVNMQPVDAQGQIGASIQCMHNNINDAIEALSADLVNQYDVMGFLITE